MVTMKRRYGRSIVYDVSEPETYCLSTPGVALKGLFLHVGFGCRGLLACHLIALLLLLPLSACIGGASWRPPVLPVGMVNARLSPDGRIVVFEYYDTRSLSPDQIRHGMKRYGLGLLDWRSGKLTRIPNPSDGQLSDASWSYDGKKLVACMGPKHAFVPTRIVFIDPNTFKITTVIDTPYSRDQKAYMRWRDPVLQPETGNIVYIQEWWNVPYHIHMYHVDDGTDEVILPKENGFSSLIMNISFISRDEFIFVGMSPRGSAIKESVSMLIGEGINGKNIIYKVKISDRNISIFNKNITKKLSDEERIFVGLSKVSSSKNGANIIATGLSQTSRFNKNKKYNYELFDISNGRIKQITNLSTWINTSYVSYDGSTIVFGADKYRRKIMDFFVLDVKTNRVFQTNLMERVSRSQEFRIQ